MPHTYTHLNMMPHSRTPQARWSVEHRKTRDEPLCTGSLLCFALLRLQGLHHYLSLSLSLSLSIPLSRSLSGVPSILNPNTGMLPKRHVHHNIAACLGQRSFGDVRP